MTTVSELYLEVALESDLERVLRVLDVTYTDMSFLQKRDAVVSNFTDLTGWYFNETIYKFQIEEIIKIVLTQQQITVDEEEYTEWIELHDKFRAEALAAASGAGFSYSYTGKLFDPTTGTITGVVASGFEKAETITLSMPGTSGMELMGRNGAFVNEVTSIQMTDNAEGYNMNFNKVTDPSFPVGKFTDGFSWDRDSIYDYVFLYSKTAGENVVLSDLSLTDVDEYLREDWFKTVMMSNAIAKYKEKYVHGRLASTRRMNEMSKQKMLDIKDYIDVMGDIEV